MYLRMHCAPLNSFSERIIGIQAIIEDFTDNKGNVEYINSKYIELTGYTPDDVISNNASMLYAKDRTSEEYYKELLNAVNTGNVWRKEVFNERKNGEGSWILTVSRRLMIPIKLIVIKITITRASF